MPSNNVYTSDTCQLHCVDNDKTMLAEVLSFKSGKSLSVSVLRQIKLEMKYNNISHVYEGKMGGLTFVTPGPIITHTKTSR